jgi:hypothetical protein
MKYLKIALKSLLVLLLFLGLSLISLYHYYDQELPDGEQGVEADRLAQKMLTAMNYDAYKELDYIEWTFSSRGRKRSYKWQKTQGRCTVVWDSISVDLNIKAVKKSSVQVNNLAYIGKMKDDFIRAAEAKFNNDTFWLVAPYKLFDKGVERHLVNQRDGSEALLVTYTSGGNTPGDSYLWFLEEDYKPKAFQMWVSIFPIGGLEASWEKWEKTTNGAYLPRLHKVLFLDLEITRLNTTSIKP